MSEASDLCIKCKKRRQQFPGMFCGKCTQTAYHGIYNGVLLRGKNPGDVANAEDIRFMFLWWDAECATCGASLSLQVDHIIPLSSADFPGSRIDNLMPLCKVCNMNKFDHELETWLVMRFGSIQAALTLRKIRRYQADASAWLAYGESHHGKYYGAEILNKLLNHRLRISIDRS